MELLQKISVTGNLGVDCALAVLLMAILLQAAQALYDPYSPTHREVNLQTCPGGGASALAPLGTTLARCEDAEYQRRLILEQHSDTLSAAMMDLDSMHREDTARRFWFDA